MRVFSLVYIAGVLPLVFVCECVMYSFVCGTECVFSVFGVLCFVFCVFHLFACVYLCDVIAN